MKTRYWISIFLLGFAGQLAWAVENQFFNTFMYDRIIPQPFYISLMVAASALTATVTSIIMGALSDKMGRRRPFLLAGYILWGVSILVIPFTGYIAVPVVAAAALIAMDCIMTFFGSTANDAAFNAYLTDVTDVTNRGRAQSVASVALWLSLMVVYGSSGAVIQNFGYTVFFVGIGALVLVVGVIGGMLIKDDVKAPPRSRESELPLFRRIAASFSLRSIREHREIFTILLAMGLWGMAFQVFFPFLIIYLKNYLQISMLNSTILMFVSLLVGGLLASIPAGFLTDRFGRKIPSLAAIAVEATALLCFAFSRSMALLAVFAVCWLGAQSLWWIATGAWSKDLYPEDRRGEFSGYMTMFTVAFTMIPGPLIGNAVIEHYGIRAVIDNKQAIIPTPEIFYFAAAMMLLPAIPVWLCKDPARKTGTGA